VALDKASNTPVSQTLNQTNIPGLFVCGNSYKVYDLVDWVTRDSAQAGAQAVQYLEAKNK
jgi:DNA-binding LacI/PurR family transcriptional regulator